MAGSLKISIGQCSDKGHKEINQDFHGALIPNEPLLSSKGIAIALADGIGSSQVSQIASEFAVRGFLEDYYCTSESWSVKRSIERVLTATNAWLYSRSQQSQYRYDHDKGYVCTLSALVIKSSTAHLFHVGDTRIYRVHASALEQLTQDHRVWIGADQSYVSRAVGFKAQIDIDYQALPIEKNDVFLLASDGVYEHVKSTFMIDVIALHRADLDVAAQAIVAEALKCGSQDNLTVQIVAVEDLPAREAGEVHRQVTELALPPILSARQIFDGYRIIRELHASHRSHIYLALDLETEVSVVIKIPSIDLRENREYLERFMLEEWVARRINSAHVLKPREATRKRNFLYVVMEFVEGQTLAQWMRDHPKPELEAVRGIVEQIAKGLQSFHRLEMFHQDLRPENIMIDTAGTVKIIDFGATRVAGIEERSAPMSQATILGTAQYTAPEYFIGEAAGAGSDLFSLGVIAYQMLSGRLPYGAEVAKARTPSAQRKLKYQSVLDEDREIPVWIDGALSRAVHPDPRKRYEALSEFIYDLRHPNAAFLTKTRAPLVDRHPVLFWKLMSAGLAMAVLALMFLRFGVK
jgi:serine/threonine protein phosphatase PrpC/predicted Ser/Thr protein kinase